MKNRLLFLLKYTLFWLFFFICLKILLLAYHYKLFASFSAIELMHVFISGFKLDLSFTAYILAIPTFLLAIFSFGKEKILHNIFKYYTISVLALISFLAVVDLEILKWWGIRADKTIFKYFQVPKEILGTVTVAPIGLLLSIFVVFTLLFVFITYRLLKNAKLSCHFNPFIECFCFLFFTALLVIPMRGGLQQIPINESAAYFSKYNILNQAAVNLPWAFSNSFFARTTSFTKPYTFKELKNPEGLIKPLYKYTGTSKKVLDNEKPNIIIVIWESFSYKSTTDPRNLTPEFNKLKQEGVFFNNIYSSGERSDKGITAVLSAYPALPRFSIMNDPVKASKIPSLSKIFKKRAYTTSFVYGGESAFANLKSYLYTTGFDKIIEKENFPEKLQTSKWGVHDQYTYAKLLSNCSKQKEPFFSVLYTLSSHEPYDVPLHYINGSSNEEKFCNSMHYSDSCLGNFVRQAKKKPWWKNTVMLIISDHGHIFPGKNEFALRTPDEFHIPMLWLGGALCDTTVITKMGSQIDLASTLLNQLNIPDSSFYFSKDILNANSPQFAYMAFNNGFGLMQAEKRSFVLENIGNRFLYKQDSVSEKDILLGKAFAQFTYSDFLDK